MITVSVLIFAVAALLGLTVAIQILKNKETNKAVAVIHGLAAAIALVILLVYFVNNNENRLLISIILFIAAALGGAVLVARDFMRKPGPKALVIIHALAAVTGFVILLIFVFGR